jgi:hypothetical protein
VKFFLFLIKGDDINVYLVADLNHVAGLLTRFPAQLGNMNHSVHSADVNKGAVEVRDFTTP